MAHGGRAAVQAAVRGKGPFLLGSGATVEGGRRPFAGFGQVAHAVQAWLVKSPQLGMRLGQGQVCRPQFQPVEELLAPLAAGAAEEFVVAPDLRLESRLGTVEPSAFRRQIWPGPARPPDFRGQPPREDSPESGQPARASMPAATRAKVPSPLCSTRRRSWISGGPSSVTWTSRTAPPKEAAERLRHRSHSSPRPRPCHAHLRQPSNARPDRGALASPSAARPQTG